MKHFTVICTMALMLLALTVPASASSLDYSIDAPEAPILGTPTTDETVYVAYDEPANTDRSKNAALIPPVFGSPTSNLSGSGEQLTPNLVREDTAVISGGASNTAIPPTVTISSGGSVAQSSGGNGFQSTIYPSTSYTAVTSDLYYNAGYLAKLKIPAIGLTVNVYEGTDSATLAKGAGHFSSTSIWGGNVAIAAHNRGVANHFGKIHTLEIGDTITYTTKLGTATYEVYSVQKIAATDVSVLRSSGQDVITLVTCVANQPDYRWCVQAKSIA